MTDQPGVPAAPVPPAPAPPLQTPHAPPLAPPPSADAPAPGPDWTDQVADLIVDSVDKVRSRTTGPVLDVARGSVYAVVAAILAGPVLVLLAAGVVRFADYWIPGDVWIVYAIFAAVLLVAGSLLWSKRRPRTAGGTP